MIDRTHDRSTVVYSFLFYTNFIVVKVPMPFDDQFRETYKFLC